MSTNSLELIFFLKQSLSKSTNCSKLKSFLKKQNILTFNISTLFFCCYLATVFRVISNFLRFLIYFFYFLLLLKLQVRNLIFCFLDRISISIFFCKILKIFLFLIEVRLDILYLLFYYCCLCKKYYFKSKIFQIYKKQLKTNISKLL